MSTALGYNTARYLTLQGYPNLPLIIYFINEFTLAMTIRDNLSLIFLQVFYPSKW